MKDILKRVLVLSMALVTVVCFSSCGGGTKSVLDPDNPVTVTVWNYYNGDQLAAFEKLVEEFNASVGAEKGVVVVSASQGDVNSLADTLLDAVEGKAGAEDVPTLAQVYAETAYILDQKDALAPFDSYFSDEELSKYVEGFLDEGRFNEKNELMSFPTSKSTEVFNVNKTDWADFAKATGVKLENVKTIEDLVSAAEKYYQWTDSLTPNVKEDGKALYGRDSMANYIYIGSNQLGHEMFKVEDGKLSIDIDRDTFKTLWDNYYIPYINGYFGSYAKFRSDDMKTGKILALTSSTTGVGYLPSEVFGSGDAKHSVEIYSSAPLDFENAKNNVEVQQGAGYSMLKTTDGQQEGAVEFIKWFTEEERNLEFSTLSGYSPVVTSANDKEKIKTTYEKEQVQDSQKNKNMLDALLISADVYTNDTPYAVKPFTGSKDVRTLCETAMQDAASADRKAVESAIATGVTREEAVRKYSTDEYFDKWFKEFKGQIEKLTK